MPAVELSPNGVFQHATPVVQAVLVILLLSSVLCWTVILEKTVILLRLSGHAKRLEAVVFEGGVPLGSVSEMIVLAGREEWRDAKVGDSAADRRDRIERAMRDVVFEALIKSEARLPYLATIGSAAPFIGLFGTVWGIMHSFSAIAHSNDTSLAVVAPGIAEALSTTAAGLAAAIPASIAYNKLASDFAGLARRFGLAIGRIARRADDPGGVLGGPP